MPITRVETCVDVSDESFASPKSATWVGKLEFTVCSNLESYARTAACDVLTYVNYLELPWPHSCSQEECWQI